MRRRGSPSVFFFFSPQGSGIHPFFVALTNPSSRILVAHIRSSCPTAAPPTQRPESMHQQNKRSALSFFPIIQDSSDACISLCQSVQSLLRTKFQTPLRHKLQIPTRDHYPIILSTIFLQFLFLIFFYTKIFFQLPLQFSLSYDHISHPIHTSKWHNTHASSLVRVNAVLPAVLGRFGAFYEFRCGKTQRVLKKIFSAEKVFQQLKKKSAIWKFKRVFQISEKTLQKKKSLIFFSAAEKVFQEYQIPFHPSWWFCLIDYFSVKFGC